MLFTRFAVNGHRHANQRASPRRCLPCYQSMPSEMTGERGRSPVWRVVQLLFQFAPVITDGANGTVDYAN